MANRAGRSTFELQLRLHDAACEVEPASVVEAARQLREIGVASRDQTWRIIDAAVQELLFDAIRADRAGAKLIEQYERCCAASEPPEAISAALRQRSNQLRVYLLRRLGQHEMAESLRRDQTAYDEIADHIPLSDWLEAQLRAKQVEEGGGSS